MLQFYYNDETSYELCNILEGYSVFIKEIYAHKTDEI